MSFSGVAQSVDFSGTANQIAFADLTIGSVTASEAVRIVQPPTNQIVQFGASVSFSVAAAGAAPLGYQWQFNGANLANNAQITGSQSNVLTLASVAMSNSGTYQVVVTNAYSSSNASATLTVIKATPTISWTNPSAITYGTPLSSIQLNATANVPGTFAYTPTNGTVINAGTNALSVIFTPTDLVDYTIVTDSVSLVVLPISPLVTWPNPAPVTYGAALSPTQLNASANVSGTYSYNPPTGTILSAGTNTLSLTFTPTDIVDYKTVTSMVTEIVQTAPLSVVANNVTRQYGQTNPLFSGTITGLTNGDNITASYTCSATPSSVPGMYPIVPALIDPNGRVGNYSVTLNNGSLTISPGPPPTLASISPVIGVTNGGTVVTLAGTGFEIGAKVGFGSLAASSVSVNATNNLTAVTPASPAGVVNVTLTNADGNTVTLTNAFTFGIPPIIQTQPMSQAVLVGSNAQFQVQVAGTAPQVFQWQFNGANLLDFEGISGSHTSTLTLSNLSLAQAGTYSVMIINLFGAATSAGAVLTVLEKPSITTGPQGFSAGLGANANLSVTATGTQPLSYQWYQNGSALVGATSSVLNFVNLQATNQGSYTVVVTNIAGSVTSAPAVLNVLIYCASAQTSQTIYPVGTTVPISFQTFACGSSTPAPNSAAVIWIYEAGTSRSYPVVTDGAGHGTMNFVPLPGEAGLCQFAAALPDQSPPAAQGSFTLVGMSLSLQSLSPQLIVGIPQTNVITLSNLTSVELSGLVGTVVGAPADVNVQVTVPGTLAGNGTAQASIVLQATGNSPSQAQFAIQFTSGQGTTNDVTVNASMAALTPQLAATPASLNAAMLAGGQTLVSFSLANLGGAASGPVQVLLPSTPWLSLVTTSTIPSLAPGASNQVTLALTPAANLALGPYGGSLLLVGSNTELQVPFNFDCVSSQEGALQVTVQDELSIYGAGNPNLSNATVMVSDYFTGSNVASAVTGGSGVVLFTNLVSAYYNVAVSAPDHGSFTTTLLVAANQTNDLVAFLALQLVDLTWTVTPTEVPDDYVFTLITTFQTEVPWPVVTMTPGAINLCTLNGDSNQVDLVITNNGLIAAENLQLVFGTNADWLLKPLTSTLGTLPGESGLVVPLMIVRLGTNADAASSIAAQLNWQVNSATQTNYYTTPIFVYNANPANCTISSAPVVTLTPGTGTGGGGGGGGGVPPVSYTPPPPPSVPSGAIVDVTLLIEQTAVISRNGFNATLQLTNNSDAAITDIKVTINPQDASGNPASNYFAVEPPVLMGLKVDGTGSLAIGVGGSASWTIIPSTNAAPDGPTNYAIGGTLSYVINGEQVTIPLWPVTIMVLPCPILNIDYFLQHDVYGDDPFTPQVEPSIPFALGILVRNSGQGIADDFTITSFQPEIVSNVDDLIFNPPQLIGSQVGANQSITPSLTLDLGSLGPDSSAVGLWYLTSSLEGEFINFSATYKHTDALQSTNTSIISTLRTHEMNHVVRITYPTNDGLPDFLVNDNTNVDALPGVVYSSDGSTNPVTSITSGVTVGTPSSVISNVSLTASVPSGYVYFEVVDPGANVYPIASVKRSDGVNLLVGPNVWQTPERIHLTPPQPNNLIHIFDYNSTGSYTITYGQPNLGPVPVILSGTRVYDGTSNASAMILNIVNNQDGTNLTLTGNATLAGANVGVQNIIVFSNLTLGGAAASNYTLTGASGSVIVTASEPAITCPLDIVTNQSYALGCSHQLVAFAPVATGSPAPTLVCTLNGNPITSPFSFPLGTNLVTCIASNQAGVQSCSFTVTVTNAPPVAGPFAISPQEGTAESIPIAKLLQVGQSPSGGPLSITGVTSPTTNGAAVTMGGGLITYAPAANFVGADTINYVVTDGCLTAPGAISVTVTSANAPSQNGLTIQMSDGHAILQFHGIPGQAYYVQVAQSLSGPWTDLPGTPVTANALGLISYTVSMPTSPSFYRTSVNP